MTGQLKWPSGLVIDAASQKRFWADAGMDKIEYSNLDVRSFVLFSHVRLNILQTSSCCLPYEYARFPYLN